MSWVKRKTSYTTGSDGVARATSRVLVFAGGRTETLSASALVGVTPEKRMVDGKERIVTDGVAQANYPSSGNVFQRTPAEMRSRAAELAKELGLRTRTPSATRTTTPAARARALALELGQRSKPEECECPCIPCSTQNDCEHCDCDGCDATCSNADCECADHRSAITATVGRTLYPIDRAALQQQRELDERIFEARMKRKLATSR